MKNLLNTLKYLIGWPLSFIALFFLFKTILPEFSTAIHKVSSVNIIPLGLGILCFLLYFFTRAFFWQKLISKNARKISFKETSYIWAISELKRFVPGNVWSLVGRFHLLGEKGIGKKSVFTFYFVEIKHVVLA